MDVKVYNDGDIHPISEYEMRRIDEVLTQSKHKGFSYDDLVLQYKDHEWNRYSENTLKKIWKGPGNTPTDIHRKKGYDTGMERVSGWSKDSIVSKLKLRVKKTIEDITIKKRINDEKDLQKQGIASIGERYRGTILHLEEGVIPLAFKGNSLAKTAKENAENYIEGKEPHLNILEMALSNSSIHPEYIRFVLSLLQAERDSKSLLIYDT